MVGVRGTSQINRSELEAHLGMALRTENIGVLLGAGTSICAGGRSMRSIWNDLLTDHAATVKWIVDNGFALEPTDDQPADVEDIIDRFAIAELDLRRRGLHDSTELREVNQHRAIIYQLLLRASLLDQQYWSGDSDPAVAPSLSPHRTFLARLISSRSPGQDAPWVFSTNYDLAVEWSAEALGLEVINGFGGLHDRRFASSRFDLGFRNVQASGLARLGAYHLYLVKLHGSLTWERSAREAVREVSAAHAWPQLSKMIEDLAEAEKLGDRVLILPNTQKYLATSGYIHGELVRRFTEFLGRPQTTLVVAGYSFNDEHLNRVVRSALNNPTLHLVAFLPEFVPDGDHLQALSTSARELVGQLISMSSPRVTLVGAESARFEELVQLLPEPALLDDLAAQGLRVERLLAAGRASDERPESDDNR